MSTMPQCSEIFIFFSSFATYRDDGLLVIGAIVEGIMALRVGHYSTAGPALKGTLKIGARGSARQGRDFRGQGRGKEKKGSRRLFIAESRHWLAGVKFGMTRRKCKNRELGESRGPTACTGTRAPEGLNGRAAAGDWRFSVARTATPLAVECLQLHFGLGLASSG